MRAGNDINDIKRSCLSVFGVSVVLVSLTLSFSLYLALYLSSFQTEGITGWVAVSRGKERETLSLSL